MKNSFKYILLFLLFLLLILIRVFEDQLFYDLYLMFFQNDYLYIDSLHREVLKVTLFTTLWYVLNSAMSLGIFMVFLNIKASLNSLQLFLL